MAILDGWLPPSRENWEFVVWLWQFFPLFTAVQWLTDFYPQGKTSISSRFNLPGKWAWFVMELPGAIIVLYCMFTLPPSIGLSYSDLPVGNWTMLVLYEVHYLYRAVLSPLVLNPGMSPIHPIVFISAFGWQVINGLGLAGWICGHGPTTVYDWAGRGPLIVVGLVIWGWSLLGNMFHDDELREIRREGIRRQQREEEKTTAKNTDRTNKGDNTSTVKTVGNSKKVYMMPKNGLYHYIFYPHYLCEFFEWGGYWMIGGLDCVPARNFLFNEISTMVPRALAGRRWYVQTFGKDAVGNRKAIIPFVL